MSQPTLQEGLRPIRVGCIGTGNISGQYLSMQQTFPVVDMVAVADLDRERAQAAADKHGVGRVMTPDELLASDEVEVVLNLTIPKAHVEVGLQAVEHGKHVYLEKPLGIDRDDAKKLLDAADAKDVRVGCAPDTFLGAGHQTARQILDRGELGDITAFTALLPGRGHEHWHPSPEFYYQAGGGPMLDMGPYYLTALLHLLGPAKRLAGMTSIAIPERIITSEAKRGQTMKVDVPDHYCGSIEFANGVVGSIIQSFAMRNTPKYPQFVVCGTKATMLVPDPNGFDGKVKLKTEGDEGDFVEQEMTHPTGYGRSVGLADLAYAIQSGRPHRCSGRQAYVVLDMMQGFQESGKTGRFHEVAGGYERPAPMPTDLPQGQLDQ